MKKTVFFILLLSLINHYSFCQQAYDFNTVVPQKSQWIQQIDSISMYQAYCTAVYPAYGILKSHMPSKNNLMGFLKKNHFKLYKQVQLIDSSCQLYQDSVDHMLVFDLYKHALPKSFDFEKKQKVECNLLILTIHGGDKTEILRFITSMKQSDTNQK